MHACKLWEQWKSLGVCRIETANSNFPFCYLVLGQFLKRANALHCKIVSGYNWNTVIPRHLLSPLNHFGVDLALQRFVLGINTDYLAWKSYIFKRLKQILCKHLLPLVNNLIEFQSSGAVIGYFLISWIIILFRSGIFFLATIALVQFVTWLMLRYEETHFPIPDVEFCLFSMTTLLVNCIPKN